MTIVKISPHCLLNPSHSLLFVIPEAVWGVGREWHHSLPPRYLKIHKLYEFGTYIRHTSWQKMTIDEVIILVTWLGYILQTRNKIRNRFPIWGSIGTILISNFVRYVRAMKELYPWHHHGSHMTWIQFTDQMKNEGQILYLKFCMRYWL